MNSVNDQIKAMLATNEQPTDRPDLIARAFELISREFADDLYHKNVFGAHECHVWTMEWQKRSLPHKHHLLTVGKESKLRTPADIDSCISACIPDQVCLI